MMSTDVPGVRQPADQGQHLLGLRDTEGGGGLVEDDDLRLLQHRTGDRHGLALTTGEGRDLLPHRLQGAHRQGLQRPGRRALHVRLVEHAVGGALAAEEHVVDDVEVLAEREVLVDDLDAEPRGVLWGVDGDRVPLEPDLPLVIGLGSGQALDQGGLPGTVVAHEGGHLARAGLPWSTPLRTSTGPKLLRMSSSSISALIATPAALGRAGTRPGVAGCPRTPRPSPGLCLRSFR